MATNTEQQDEIYDLLIVADATGSMTGFLTSLRTSIPQIISVSAVTNCFSRVGLLYYRDYEMKNVLAWHGWVHPSKIADLEPAEQESQPDLVSIAQNARAFSDHGCDNPEAVKTALAKVYEVSRENATTIVLLYTDASPHMSWDVCRNNLYEAEKKSLEDPTSFGGHGPKFVDWVSACKTLCNGGKRIQTFCVLENTHFCDCNTYNYLSTITGGACVQIRDRRNPATISRLTVEILLAWMGVEKAGLSHTAKREKLGALLAQSIDSSDIDEIQDESSPIAQKVFTSSSICIEVTSETLKEYLPKKKVPVQDLAQQWKNDPRYRNLVIAHLERMIQYDVRTISLNPVLGSLWRLFCNDRTIDNRDAILASFSRGVSNLSHEDERAWMKKWLEDSYDFDAEIRELIGTVPADERFPCVYLDPTERLERTDPKIEDNEDENTQITEFSRDELLEIGRSCDARILRRLGFILTRLTYVQKASDMPRHIVQTSDAEVPKIPLALSAPKYKSRFWNVILHTILPGTILSDRPASLLAALSLKMGVDPLRDVAGQRMLAWRAKWNNTEVPETWNVQCLSLILDAEKAYRQRIKTVAQQNQDDLLCDDDRDLFEALIALKVLERNLGAPLMAKVGWTPQKSLVPIGAIVTCRSCEYPRSVTIMGERGKCGICLCEDYSVEGLQSINSHVSKDDNESTLATWVECSVPTCQGQYIVYHRDALNVRPKCHYCRTQDGPAPLVECIKCFNKVIFPQSYRPPTFSEFEFLCAACTAGRQSIVETETTAEQISSENGTGWLAVDTDFPSQSPFDNRSLYHTITRIGTTSFNSRIKLFPDTHDSLRLHGKIIHNPQELINKLKRKISKRHTELVSCSLCFSNYRPHILTAACGRRGCIQRVCQACLDGWYGLNSAGCIINTASLHCPFCRRRPSPRTLAKHGMGIHAVGNLSQAMKDQGQWIYAWCGSCGYAKQYMERVCARGVPDDIRNWKCDECQLPVEHDRSKPCPGCGVMCEKTSGCGHITCPVSDCNTHWCYFCGKAFNNREIYKHMSMKHGGFFGPNDDDNDFVYDDDDDYTEDELIEEDLMLP